MPQNLTKIPKDFIAGDTVIFTITDAEYPAPTWTLTYYFNQKNYKTEVVASASGTDHLVTISKTVSAKFAPGIYSYQAKVDNGSEQYTIDTGRIEVIPDASSAKLDALTIAENIVDKIDFSLLERVTDDFVEIWTEEGRKYVANDLSALTKVRDKYVAIIENEISKRERGAGRTSKSRRILVKFGRITG